MQYRNLRCASLDSVVPKPNSYASTEGPGYEVRHMHAYACAYMHYKKFMHLYIILLTWMPRQWREEGARHLYCPCIETQPWGYAWGYQACMLPSGTRSLVNLGGVPTTCTWLTTQLMNMLAAAFLSRVGSFVKALIWCGIGQWWRQAVDTMLQVWRTLGQGLAANRPTEGRTMSGTSRGSPINPSLGQTSKGRAVSVEAALSYALSKVTLCHFMWFWSVTGILYCSWCSWEMYLNICMYIQRVLFLKGWSFSLSQWA